MRRTLRLNLCILTQIACMIFAGNFVVSTWEIGSWGLIVGLLVVAVMTFHIVPLLFGFEYDPDAPSPRSERERWDTESYEERSTTYSSNLDWEEDIDREQFGGGA